MYILSYSALTLGEKYFTQADTFFYNEKILLKNGQPRELEWQWHYFHKLLIGPARNSYGMEISL